MEYQFAFKYIQASNRLDLTENKHGQTNDNDIQATMLQWVALSEFVTGTTSFQLLLFCKHNYRQRSNCFSLFERFFSERKEITFIVLLTLCWSKLQYSSFLRARRIKTAGRGGRGLDTYILPRLQAMSQDNSSRRNVNQTSTTTRKILPAVSRRSVFATPLGASLLPILLLALILELL